MAFQLRLFERNLICTKITRMSDERRKDNLDETAKNAFTGYTMVVLGVVCFIIMLVIVAAIVRLIVSASAGAGI